MIDPRRTLSLAAALACVPTKTDSADSATDSSSAGSTSLTPATGGSTGEHPS